MCRFVCVGSKKEWSPRPPKFTGTESRNNRRPADQLCPNPCPEDRPRRQCFHAFQGSGMGDGPGPVGGVDQLIFFPMKSRFVPTPWEALCRREKCGGFFAVGSGQPWKPRYSVPAGLPPVRSGPDQISSALAVSAKELLLIFLPAWLYFEFVMCRILRSAPPAPAARTPSSPAHLLVSIT